MNDQAIQDKAPMKAALGIAQALRLESVPCPVVSLVGGGGKSTTLFRLGAALATSRRRVLLTTTTRMFTAQLAQAPHLVRLRPEMVLPGDLAALFAGQGGDPVPLLLVGPDGGDGKTAGIPPAVVDGLVAAGAVDAVVVEADGSRMRPFKAPGPHEPMVPATTTHFVPVVGADAVGVPLTEAGVHRPEQVVALTGVSLGGLLTPEVIAQVVAHADGGLKGRPATSRVVPLINKADQHPAAALALAAALLAYPVVDEVVVAALGVADGLVTGVYGRVAGIVLAAGQGSRFGRTKQLAPWGSTTLVAHAASTALAAGLNPVVVVVGHDHEQVAASVGHLPVSVVANPDYAMGQASSVVAGVRALLPARARDETSLTAAGGRAALGAALFLLADQPLITPPIIQQLVQTHQQTLAPIVVPTYQGQRGNPVLFDRTLWPELLGMSGDTGGRALFQIYQDQLVQVAMESSAILKDIDTPEALAALQAETPP